MLKQKTWHNEILYSTRTYRGVHFRLVQSRVNAKLAAIVDDLVRLDSSPVTRKKTRAKGNAARIVADVVVLFRIHAAKRRTNARNKRPFVARINSVACQKLIFNVINKSRARG
jgi:hypothetical protein